MYTPGVTPMLLARVLFFTAVVMGSFSLSALVVVGIIANCLAVELASLTVDDTQHLLKGIFSHIRHTHIERNPMITCGKYII